MAKYVRSTIEGFFGHDCQGTMSSFYSNNYFWAMVIPVVLIIGTAARAKVRRDEDKISKPKASNIHMTNLAELEDEQLDIILASP